MSKLRKALGLMSGTSLDGIDVALIETDGEDIVRRGPSATYAYSDGQRATLRAAIAIGKTLESRRARTPALSATEEALTHWHAEAVRGFRAAHRQAAGRIDVIGFHGQTVFHGPDRRITVQIGDGALLARLTGASVVADMRAADVAAGGQGAPLVPVYHRALAASFAERPVAFLNIGGVANVTWVGADGSLLAFDTGPGNALLNDWCERLTGAPLDRDGVIASRGAPDAGMLQRLLAHPYFDRPAPKSLDRDAFDISALNHLSLEDGAATLVGFTAASAARAARLFPGPPELWIVCGGGRHNPALMRALGAELEPLSQPVRSAEDMGLDGDAVEAEAWAYLAVRSLKGLPLTYPGTTRAPEPLTGGVRFDPA